MKKLWMAALGIFLAVGLTACQGEGAGESGSTQAASQEG